MSSNRKWVIAALVLFLALICAVVIFFLFQSSPSLPQSGSSAPGCLVFQSISSQEPCYAPETLPNPESSSGAPALPNASSGSSSAPLSLSPAATAAISSCASPVSIETVDCLEQTALRTRDSSICSAIQGAFDRNDCLGLLAHGPEQTKDAWAKAISSYDFSVPTLSQGSSATSGATLSSAEPAPLSALFSDMLSSISSAAQQALNSPDQKFTADGYYQRVAAHPRLALYAFSEYQAAPGSTLEAIGSGFTPSGNTLYIGGTSIGGLSSSDGSTLSFTVPSLPDGSYECWVTNSNGSSEKPDAKIMLVVTRNPAPRPVIERYSPADPSALDAIAFSGANLSSSVNIVTTLGNLSGVRSSGGSFSIKVSDLPYYQNVKDVAGVKGKKLALFIYAQNENGISKDPFEFDVQF